MKRTPLSERELPNYTRAQERANSVTHIIGAAIGIAVLVLGVIRAAMHHSGLSLAGGIVFGVSMIALYTISSLYHGLKDSYAKRVMQVLDHCTIYLLILGTYTPILVTGIMPYSRITAWIMIAGEIAIAAVGATFTAIDHNKYKKLSMLCYISMGWLVVFVLRQAVEVMSIAGFVWLLAGGVAYTVGAVLYNVGKKKSVYHTVFHVFTLIASVLQAVCILGYVL